MRGATAASERGRAAERGGAAKRVEKRLFQVTERVRKAVGDMILRQSATKAKQRVFLTVIDENESSQFEIPSLFGMAGNQRIRIFLAIRLRSKLSNSAFCGPHPGHALFSPGRPRNHVRKSRGVGRARGRGATLLHSSSASC